MAESPVQEITPQDAPIEDSSKSPIAKRVGTMSDRAIQRVTGGNAFLRGRLYARRNAISNLNAEGESVSGEIVVRSSADPYRTTVNLGPENTFISECNCPGWRGPDGHCKHVAAILVALRDRERPPKPQPPAGAENQRAAKDGKKEQRDQKEAGGRRGKKAQQKPEPVHVAGTVSVGGTRRRGKRRRGRGELALERITGEPVEAVSRGPVDAWLPPDALPKPCEFEYRINIRSSSVNITPVVAGTRNAAPIEAALAAFNMVDADDRSLFRHLARNASRGQPATAELRGEDAAEVFELLRGRRVVIEPASMELRITDEPLRPHLELERASSGSVKVRALFILESNGRRFSLSSGAWFEGNPGYHVDTTEGVARPIADAVTPAWLQRLSRTPAIVYPYEELPELLTDIVPRVANSLGADLPDLSQIADLVDADPKIELRLNGDIVTIEARLAAHYREHRFDIPTKGLSAPLAFDEPKRAGGRPRIVRRDVGKELIALQALMGLGFTPDESGEMLTLEGEEAIDFWTSGIATLPEDWIKRVPDDLVDVKIRKESVSAQARVSSGVDWLSLDMVFSAGGKVVAEDELRACLEQGRRIVKLEDGSYAPVDPKSVNGILSRLTELMVTSGGERDSKLPLSQVGRVNELLELVEDKKVTTAAKNLFETLDDVGEIPDVPKPRALKATLRPYQKAGFNWLAFIHGLGSGGILADDMGLGKTLQTIALLLWTKTKSKKKRLHLVVAPTSVVPNWIREIEKFAPSMKAVAWQGPNRHDYRDELDDADVMVTSYALLRRDEELLAELDLGYAILDEAQHIKNPMSQTARAAKRLKAERRLALTGTPIENRLSEIWSIFDFVSPGLLGGLKSFEENYARAIDRGDDEAAEKLRKIIQPFILRRLKQDVAADLPEKIEQEIIVPLGDEQAILYQQILSEVRKSVMSDVEKQGVSKSQIKILAALTRLRQVACDPRLMKLPDREFDADMSGKLGALREIIAASIEGGHRVLVFSQFVEMLSLIRAVLDEDGVAYEYLDGSTKDRLERVERFNEDDSIPVFLISLKAGGTGLNLTGADTVVHFDPWWNPAVEDQATDRAHRIGQTRVVTVYRLIAKGTVEEKILRLSEKKRALVSSVLSTEGSPLKGLTKTDVDSLFSTDE